MSKFVFRVLILQLFLIASPLQALEDQGLSSIMSIIDKAVEEFSKVTQDQELPEPDKLAKTKSTSSTIVNLARTLGKLSYSRLQCGQADVLAEFTQRVQNMPADFRDPMRDAFQLGFDKSKAETALLSADECERLTQSRTLGEKKLEANVEELPQETPLKEVEKPKPVVDPKLKHLRLAELTGQLAYKRKFCGDNKVINRDFNEVISNMPQEFQEEAKASYWKGYQHGKRLNSSLSKQGCL
ncbi:MAG: hypothetical protein H8E21_05140 [Gammaproteobacteria bacterium]|nr:hypothetical protein [Gammaproteobacteria bacterium]MBL6999140.1 hypothetical protein [Gammaproteobacteria bacterium]